MNRALRVLVVSDEMHGLGGAGRVQLAVAGGLGGRGHAVDLAYLSDGPALNAWTGIAEHSFHVNQLKEPPVHSSVSRICNAAAVALNAGLARLPALVRRFPRPDVVYANGHGELMAARHLAAAHHAPLVLHLHSPPWTLSELGRRKRAAWSGVAQCIAVSDAMRTAWSDAGLERARIQTIHNGVPLPPNAVLDKSTRIDARARLGLDPESFIVGYVGRIDETKGVHVLADAVSSISESRPDLAILGMPRPGSPHTDYEQAIADRASSGEVVALTATQTPIDFYAACDVIAVPSIYEDPFPLVILEALATGTPVITSRVGGCLEGLPDELLQFSAEPGNPSELAESIKRLRDALAVDHDMPRRLRSHIRANFSLDSMLAKIEDLLVGTARS